MDTPLTHRQYGIRKDHLHNVIRKRQAIGMDRVKEMIEAGLAKYRTLCKTIDTIIVSDGGDECEPIIRTRTKKN